MSREYEYKLKDTIKIILKTPVSTFYLIDMGTGLNIYSKSVVPKLCRSRIQSLTVPLLQTRNSKPLELKHVVLRHVLIEALNKPLRFGTVNKLAVNVLVRPAFIHRHKRANFPSTQRIKLKSLTSIWTNANPRCEDKQAQLSEETYCAVISGTGRKNWKDVAWTRDPVVLHYPLFWKPSPKNERRRAFSKTFEISTSLETWNEIRMFV